VGEKESLAEEGIANMLDAGPKLSRWTPWLEASAGRLHESNGLADEVLYICLEE
jgi:hypothetical protein